MVRWEKAPITVKDLTKCWISIYVCDNLITFITILDVENGKWNKLIMLNIKIYFQRYRRNTSFEMNGQIQMM